MALFLVLCPHSWETLLYFQQTTSRKWQEVAITVVQKSSSWSVYISHLWRTDFVNEASVLMQF